VVIREIRGCLLLGSFVKQVPRLGLKSSLGMTIQWIVVSG